eukprot:96759-Pyramimonas_sp.AAC.1
MKDAGGQREASLLGAARPKTQPCGYMSKNSAPKSPPSHRLLRKGFLNGSARGNQREGGGGEIVSTGSALFHWEGLGGCRVKFMRNTS